MIMDRKWEKYNGGPAASSSQMLRVTLNRKGLIYLNAKAYTAFGRPKAVAVYYNRSVDAIAVEPANPRLAESFQVVRKQNGWAIHASTFCRHFKIRVETTERFIRPEITEQGVLVLSMRETVTVGGIIRRRPRSRRDNNASHN